MAEWQTQRIQNPESDHTTDANAGFSAASDTGPSAKGHGDSPQAHQTEPSTDAVEEALAHALRQATNAGQWDVVAQLARELEARREAHADPGVIPFRPKRKGQG